jgi:hypothetical protein
MVRFERRSARLAKAVETRFECSACGLAREARVLAIGHGASDALAGHAEGSAERARELADHDATGAADVAALGALGGLASGAILAAILHAREKGKLGRVEIFDEAPRAEQLAGKKCGACKRSILIETDGAFCETCHAPVHTKECADRHVREAHAAEGNAPYR